MSDALYNDYKNNCYEYMKTVSYTEKIIKDNNSDQNKLLNIYEKAINSAENMFKRMQLEVETNTMITNKYDELNDIQKEITEYKVKLKKFKEEFFERDKINIEMTNNYDDRILLLSDVDILEKGDVYINQSKILMSNTEYISNDVMNNLNKQREYIKKNLSNISFISDKLNDAKKIMKNLKNKDLFNKYRLYIIFIFIILTFSLITCIKYNRYIKSTERSTVQPEGKPTTHFIGSRNELKIFNDKKGDSEGNISSVSNASGMQNVSNGRNMENVNNVSGLENVSSVSGLENVSNESNAKNEFHQMHTMDETNSIVYDFVEKKDTQKHIKGGNAIDTISSSDKNSIDHELLFESNKGEEKYVSNNIHMNANNRGGNSHPLSHINNSNGVEENQPSDHTNHREVGGGEGTILSSTVQGYKNEKGEGLYLDSKEKQKQVSKPK
ncbi:vesicle transport v-SNARE protein VTI1 [Plasmodium brasilianum]|uniref:Vesicle transport v-SNARE protein VTI1, putative n=2 Tax=Plasmodium (Plasmodium) TaxID=418103 RepID=A0A1A8WQT9_PLAMA|nr:vesicle transport v-SNARE protein VTI1, putative [Plasmodium malariae]KAI4835066.1 vesicle transport v-SNARE protein VTI1 [Plasmodium brasilianum]SBS94665.1 vesicle transport v-SNARE protein VTI1, putative [Plasmodium malariae]SCP03642.1 vesicle transport v-SNARE protein VTI1, putative [Plasmodium malariae]